MTWAQRFLDLARGDAGDQRRAAELSRLYSGFLVRSARLAAHAAQAPTEAAELELRALAAAEGALAERFSKTLSERQIAVPAAAIAPAAASENHWARLVQDLEAHREARSQLLEAASHVNEIDAELASRLEELSRAEEGHLVRLRTMIARADPQASN